MTTISPTLTLTADKTIVRPGETVTLSGSLNIPKEMGDIYKDNKIDARDLAIVARAFGSYPGHPRWNPDADLNKDGKVDGIDLAKVARMFGLTAENKMIILYTSVDSTTWTEIGRTTTGPGGKFSFVDTIPPDYPTRLPRFYMAYFPGAF
jgi:hypothetical protein